MLDDATRSQLAEYLQKVTVPVELIASLDETPAATEMLAFLQDVAALSPLVTARGDGTQDRRPSFEIRRTGTDVEVTFAGIPMGHEFSSFILAVLQVGGHPSKVDASVLDEVRALEGHYEFTTYYSITCQNCPDVVQALNLMSVVNPRIHHVAVDGALFQAEIEALQVLAVPTVYLNGEVFGQGRMSVEEIVGRLDTGMAAREAARLNEVEPFDVLVVGGGPAGATAAIYASRKGIRTGVAAERFGGQVLDTMGIENFASITYTEGPRLAAELEQHVASYDVDIMRMQKAVSLTPASTPGGLIEIGLENGAVLRSRTVVLSTGARWRNMNVPGEQEYRNKGVTYCPHCDGPLFKGKRVAVIGGGNSGVEAAIDLAGVVGHVTLIEFDGQLRADEVLQRKLRSLPNVDIIVSALTTQVHGDGSRVVGLEYTDRTDESSHRLDVEGIFVQIGLLPNTEWLEGSVELSPRGEVLIDDHGRTSVPGVFAAGDCTTVPFKQIVISLGAGATAALSAFDHLIRTSAPDAVAPDAVAPDTVAPEPVPA